MTVAGGEKKMPKMDMVTTDDDDDLPTSNGKYKIKLILKRHFNIKYHHHTKTLSLYKHINVCRYVCLKYKIRAHK